MTALLLLIACLPTSPALPGNLQAASPIIDLGTVLTGPQLPVHFQLIHTGATGQLEITGVETVCGCLHPQFEHRHLEPGQRSRLTVQLNTLTQPAGPQQWRTRIRYRVINEKLAGTEPAKEELVVTIKATLQKQVTVSPPEIAFSTAGSAQQIVTVTDIRSTPLKVLHADPTTQHLKVRILPLDPVDPTGTQKLQVQVCEHMPAGNYQETILLTTNDRSCPELRIPIRIQKRAASQLIVTPAEPVIRLAANQESASILLQVRQPAKCEIKILGVEATDPALGLKWASAGPVATIRVSLSREQLPSTKSPLSLKIRITDNPEQTIEVPLRWIIANKDDE